VCDVSVVWWWKWPRIQKWKRIVGQTRRRFAHDRMAELVEWGQARKLDRGYLGMVPASRGYIARWVLEVDSSLGHLGA